MGLSPNLEPMGRGWKSEPKKKGYRCNNCGRIISVKEMYWMNPEKQPKNRICPHCNNSSRFEEI